MRKLWIVAVFFAALAFCQSASAGCVGYTTPITLFCSGSGGCTGEYIRVRCTFGCVEGTCVNQGSSGECCGKIYYNAVIYPSGGSCPQCGDLPAAASSRSRHAFPAPSKHPTQASNTVTVRSRATRRVPRITFVPDTCAHAYSAAVDYGTAPRGGL